MITFRESGSRLTLFCSFALNHRNTVAISKVIIVNSVEDRPSCLKKSHEKTRESHVAKTKPIKILNAILLKKLSMKLKKRLNVHPKKRLVKTMIRNINIIQRDFCIT
jgi:hypothetical protein